jgi:hypothetical protein
LALSIHLQFDAIVVLSVELSGFVHEYLKILGMIGFDPRHQFDPVMDSLQHVLLPTLLLVEAPCILPGPSQTLYGIIRSICLQCSYVLAPFVGALDPPITTHTEISMAEAASTQKRPLLPN